MFMFGNSNRRQSPKEMSIEKSIQRRQQSISKLPLKQRNGSPTDLAGQGTNLVQENYLWTIQEPFDIDDPTIALELNMIPLPGQKKRFLDIQMFSTSLINYGGSDFPNVVSLACVQLSGFLVNGTGSHIIATTSPFNLSSTMNQGGIIGYNVLYKNETNPIWDITNIGTLTFKIKVGQDYQPLPSAQPLTVHCKITRVIF